MQGVPIDKRGYPVPYFVAWVNGEPDHRIADPNKLNTCIVGNRCWLCGGAMGAFKSFVVGPMCAVNKISSEPPSHRECARYAAMACPFMARPHAKRRDAAMPDAIIAPAGEHLTRNPGVTLIWTTRSYMLARAPGGKLFRMGPADSMEFFAEGRAATREEVDESVRTGLPSLEELAPTPLEKLELARCVNELTVALDRLLPSVAA